MDCFKRFLGEKLKCLPTIPNSWLMALFIIAMVLLRAMGIDSFTTAALAAITTFLFTKSIYTTNERRA